MSSNRSIEVTNGIDAVTIPLGQPIVFPDAVIGPTGEVTIPPAVPYGAYSMNSADLLTTLTTGVATNVTLTDFTVPPPGIAGTRINAVAGRFDITQPGYYHVSIFMKISAQIPDSVGFRAQLRRTTVIVDGGETTSNFRNGVSIESTFQQSGVFYLAIGTYIVRALADTAFVGPASGAVGTITVFGDHL